MNISIVGLGYVGLPLAIQFARSNATVTYARMLTKAKLQHDNKGASKVISNIFLRKRSGKSSTTRAFSHRQTLATSRMPTRSLSASPRRLIKTGSRIFPLFLRRRMIAPHLSKGTLVTLESTTYPGTTDEDLRAVIEKGSGLKAGVDFHLAFSPEREDPGNPSSVVATIPKIVGGLTPACLERAIQVYSIAIKELVPVASSCRVAEAAKLLENIFPQRKYRLG